jgi:hypothetical protein
MHKSLNVTTDNFINYCSLVSFPSIPISKSTFAEKWLALQVKYKGHDS